MHIDYVVILYPVDIYINMPKQYNMYIESIHIYNKDLTWKEFKDILYNFMLVYRPEECLEIEIVTLLSNSVDELMKNISKILYYLNTYCLKKVNKHMLELLNEGGQMYCNLVYLIEKSVHKRPKGNYSDRLFIKKLFSINGYLFDIFDIINDINKWSQNVSHQLNE